MKIAFTLIHILALGTCFVVQLGAPEGRECRAFGAPYRRSKTTARHVSDVSSPAMAAVLKPHEVIS
ncbi:hypothetical protein [Rhizobium jaguaris]|uniref:hypothetical protein n=1 Tax=Rhizobium jaguaris TaxID=1312183 RepID=UPI0013C3E4ED|nr:hypothetical protein [Rhizobium jaguaris]